MLVLYGSSREIKPQLSVGMARLGCTKIYPYFEFEVKWEASTRRNTPGPGKRQLGEGEGKLGRLPTLTKTIIAVKRRRIYHPLPSSSQLQHSPSTT